jgi:hypothetical protein
MYDLSLTPAFSLPEPITYRSFGLGDAIASTIAPATALGGKPFGTLSRYFLYAFANLEFLNSAVFDLVTAWMFVSMTPDLCSRP